MKRSFLFATSNAYAVALAATLLASVVGCGGGDFTLTGDDAGAGSGSSSGAGSGSSSGSRGGSSSGAGSSSGGGSSGASSGSSGGSGGGICPAGLTWCQPCPGFPGRCAQVCPAIACLFDAGGKPDAEGPPDATSNDSSICAPGEQLCPACNGPSYCAQVCPAILCVPLDAATNACSPACGLNQSCCPGGTPNSYSCQTIVDGGKCLPVP
jgi:hypothetical protein